MTSREIDIILDAVKDLKREIGVMRSDFNARLETLESDRDERRGRRQLYGALGKVTAAVSALIAAVAALIGLSQH